MFALADVAGGGIHIKPSGNGDRLGIHLHINHRAVLAPVPCLQSHALTAGVVQQPLQLAGADCAVPVLQAQRMHFCFAVSQHGGKGRAAFGQPSFFIQNVNAIRRRLQQGSLAHGFGQRGMLCRFPVRRFLLQRAGTQCHQQGQFGPIAAQFPHLPGQPAQQAADQQHQQGIDDQMARIAPAVTRFHIQRPRAVGHADGVRHRLGQRRGLVLGGGQHLNLVAVRMLTPQAVAIATPGQPVQAGVLQHIRKTHQRNGKTPEHRRHATFPVQEYRHAAHRAHAALHQREGPGQRHLAAVARHESFLVARRVGQQIMANRLFITLQRVDLPHHAVWCQLQRHHAGVVSHQRVGIGIEIIQLAMPLPHHGAERIGGGQRTVDGHLHRIAPVTGIGQCLRAGNVLILTRSHTHHRHAYQEGKQGHEQAG